MKHISPTRCLVTAALLWVAPAVPTQAQGAPAPPSAVTAAPAAAAAAPPAAPAGGDTRPIAQAPAGRDDYRVGPGDKLRIEVYRDQQLSQSVQVRPDGKITLPLIGDMEATGRTPLELRDTIATSLKEYMTNPVVTVIVVEAVASQVFVIGEVSKAGPIPLNGPTTVLQALSMAGGFKEFANRKEVRILRTTPAGTETIKFNYKDAVSGFGKPIYLKSGDTIVVP
jgi:polysaccharide export outer membrane protein